MNDEKKLNCFVFEHSDRGTTDFLEKGEYTSTEVMELALAKKHEVWITIPETYQDLRFALILGSNPVAPMYWTYGEISEGSVGMRDSRRLIAKRLPHIAEEIQTTIANLEETCKGVSNPIMENFIEMHKATINYIPVIEELFGEGWDSPVRW